MVIGIPYFGYLTSVLSDDINKVMVTFGKTIERAANRKLPKYTVQWSYFILGMIFIIILPSLLFTKVEGIFDTFIVHYQSFLTPLINIQ